MSTSVEREPASETAYAAAVVVEPAREGTAKRRWIMFAVVGVLVAGGAALWATKRSKANASALPVEHVRDVPRMDGSLVTFSPAFAKRAGIALAQVERASITPIIKVVGTVGFDPRHVGAAGARIRGFVTRVLKLPGDQVRAGEALAEIDSAELGQVQADVAVAEAQLKMASNDAQRERSLLENRLTTAREAELAGATLASQQAALAAARQRLVALGGTPTSRGLGHVVLRAPLTGTVVESHVAVGQTVEANLVAFRIANLERLWVELAVYERSIGMVLPGDPVEVSPLASPATKILGTVAHVGEVLDVDTRSADVRVQLDNRDRQLRPGQSVSAVIRTSRPKENALVVPASAVTYVDGRPTLFVATAATKVRPTAVTLGVADQQRQEVLSGVDVGQEVVVQGVFALKSELFR